MRVGDVVRTLRVSAGFKQAELAERAGISASSVSLVEAGRRDPTLKWLRRIAPVLGVPASILFAAAMAIDEAEHGNDKASAVAQQLVKAARAMLMEERLQHRLAVDKGPRKRRRKRKSA
jgi:transcriptional regulator with XRE-family HTH domain